MAQDICVPASASTLENLGTCFVPISDDFEDGVIDEERWRFVADDSATVAEEAGFFVARVPANSVSDYAFLVGMPRVDFSNCAVAIELSQAETSDVAITLFTLRDTNDRSFGWSIDDEGLRADSYVQGSVDAVVAQLPYDPVEHRWLAVRGDGENLAWLTSPNGSDWTVHGTRPPDFDVTSVELIFGIGANTDGEAIESRFDNLNLLP